MPLRSLAELRDRGEADRARAVLLTLAGWTSSRIAEAFGVREDTVRLWRSDFVRGGVEGLKANVAPGPAPVKSEAALRVVTPLLEQPVADRRNWTIPRLQVEIEAFEGVPHWSRSQLSEAPPKNPMRGLWLGDTLKARHAARSNQPACVCYCESSRPRLTPSFSLYGDESEAFTYSDLAGVWAKAGLDLRVPAPGQAKKVAMLGSLDHVSGRPYRAYQPTKRSRGDFCRPSRATGFALHGPSPGQPI